MLSWIASWFRPSESPKVHDVEAAYEPKVVAPTSSSKKATVPFAGRTFNFVFDAITNGRWFQDIKGYFNGTSQFSVTMSSTSANGLTAPDSSSMPPPSHLEMVEIPLSSTPAPGPIIAPVPRDGRQQPRVVTDGRKVVPMITPPITPTPTGPYYTICDFIAYSPYQLRVNPFYQPVAAISEKWLNDSGVHPSARKQAGFEACNFGLLTAMCYPDADYERFRVLCDYINTLFAFDDLTDEGGLRKDGNGTKKACDIIMNALHYPHEYNTEFRCGQVFSSFWGRAVELGCAPGTQRRFLEYTDLYVQAVHEQVLNRSRNYVPDIESFIVLRRDTGALKMCFAMGEFGLDVDIPDEVFECPLIQTMEDCANDVVVLSNDIYSYNIEQAQGDTCNIIEVAMKEKGLSVQGAMDYAGELVKGRIDLYTSSKAQLPSWGKRVDADVQRYLKVCEDWMTGGFYWSLESQRYFGEQQKRVKQTLCVEILPKEEGPRGQLAIPDLARAK